MQTNTTITGLNSALSARTARRIQYHIDRLADPDLKVANRAECNLLDFYASKSADLLLPLCEDPDPQKRFRAGWIIAHSKDPRAYDAVLKLCADPDGMVRYDMAIALGILGDSRGINRLEVLLRTEDTDAYVDSAAAMGMVRMGAPAVPTLIRLLQSDDSRIRNMAASALGGIGDESAIEPISTLLACADEDTRIVAVESLAEIGTSRCIELIKDRMKNDSGERVRKNADYWFGQLTKNHSA